MDKKFTDEVLAMCELSNDLFFYKIPASKYMYYIQESLKAGRSAASVYKGKNIRDIYNKNQIEVKYIDGDNILYGVEYRAQAVMSKKNKYVSLYRNSIDQLAKMSKWTEEAISYDLAVDIHLCHELYHYLEYMKKETIVEKLEPVITMRLGPFNRKANINKSSEIAAHAFGKTMLGLKYLPNIYDYIYLINRGKVHSDEFEKMAEDYGKIIYAQ